MSFVNGVSGFIVVMIMLWLLAVMVWTIRWIFPPSWYLPYKYPPEFLTRAIWLGFCNFLLYFLLFTTPIVSMLYIIYLIIKIVCRKFPLNIIKKIVFKKTPFKQFIRSGLFNLLDSILAIFFDWSTPLGKRIFVNLPIAFVAYWYRSGSFIVEQLNIMFGGSTPPKPQGFKFETPEEKAEREEDEANAKNTDPNQLPLPRSVIEWEGSSNDSTRQLTWGQAAALKNQTALAGGDKPEGDTVPNTTTGTGILETSWGQKAASMSGSTATSADGTGATSASGETATVNGGATSPGDTTGAATQPTTTSPSINQTPAVKGPFDTILPSTTPPAGYVAAPAPVATPNDRGYVEPIDTANLYDKESEEERMLQTKYTICIQENTQPIYGDDLVAIKNSKKAQNATSKIKCGVEKFKAQMELFAYKL